jgi:asparagine synthase (glutamine-hydrolysing)
MCGICGGIGKTKPTLEVIRKQLDSIEHRGPDSKGCFVSDSVSLGMCRLAIIDVKGGKQPFSHDTSPIDLVFNGEIYNFKELRALVASTGTQLKTTSEIEVICELFLQLGANFVEKINGMFAIAIHDKRDQSLYLIRDRFGKKPIWYSVKPDKTLVFASEVKSLILGLQKLTLRPGMVSEVMQQGFVSGGKSTFEEVLQVSPGSYVRWKSGVVEEIKYWKPDFSVNSKISYEDAFLETKSLLRKSVERRMISERPIGAFLSGGIDSSVVTALMSESSSNKVNTFSIGFRQKEFNEAPFARRVAEYLGTNHHEEIIEPDPILILEEISRVLCQPFADSSIIPTYILSKFARKEVVVALGGDGGDEIFGGYDRYFATKALQRFNPILALITPVSQTAMCFGNFKNRRMRRLFGQLNYKSSLAERYRSVMNLTLDNEVLRLVNSNYLDHSYQNNFENEFNSLPRLGKLNKMVRSDINSYLPYDLLVKADMASMANSLELRSPYLDKELAEFVLKLPDSYKLKQNLGKFILKDIARSMFPNHLVDRPKMGFAIPQAQWLRNELQPMTRDLLTDSTARNRGWFNQIEVNRILQQHDLGRDKDKIIWPMLMLELWARNWLD